LEYRETKNNNAIQNKKLPEIQKYQKGLILLHGFHVDSIVLVYEPSVKFTLTYE